MKKMIAIISILIALCYWAPSAFAFDNSIGFTIKLQGTGAITNWLFLEHTVDVSKIGGDFKNFADDQGHAQQYSYSLDGHSDNVRITSNYQIKDKRTSEICKINYIQQCQKTKDSYNCTSETSLPGPYQTDTCERLNLPNDEYSTTNKNSIAITQFR